MTFDPSAMFSAVVNHALASGYFEKVNQHEPKSSPGNGLSVAVWVQSIGPAEASSGLNKTTGLLVMQLRIYSNMLADPQDAIDPNVLKATDALMAAYSGDFELGGQARNIDLLGQYGEGLSAQAGYVEQDHKMFRVMTITIPIVVNDLWSQSA